MDSRDLEYAPGKCTWADSTIQQVNRPSSKFVIIKDLPYCLAHARFLFEDISDFKIYDYGHISDKLGYEKIVEGATKYKTKTKSETKEDTLINRIAENKKVEARLLLEIISIKEKLDAIQKSLKMDLDKMNGRV